MVVPDALDGTALESAQRLQVDLAERVEFEQSYLHEVLDWVGRGEKPLFNTFVNILSHEGARGPAAASSSSLTRTTTTSYDPLFVPWKLENSPLDPATAEAMEHGKTAVDGLEVGYLAKNNLYLDVERSVQEDCVDFGIRCDEALMDEGTVRAFVGEIAEEVEKIAPKA